MILQGRKKTPFIKERIKVDLFPKGHDRVGSCFYTDAHGSITFWKGDCILLGRLEKRICLEPFLRKSCLNGMKPIVPKATDLLGHIFSLIDKRI